jgi:hypothetical protein
MLACRGRFDWLETDEKVEIAGHPAVISTV